MIVDSPVDNKAYARILSCRAFSKIFSSVRGIIKAGIESGIIFFRSVASGPHRIAAKFQQGRFKPKTEADILFEKEE